MIKALLSIIIIISSALSNVKLLMAQGCSEVEIQFSRPEFPIENPLGPFHPGELVNVCVSIDFINDVQSNCQWLQGIVPSFSRAWDLTSINFKSSGPAMANWLEEQEVDYNVSNQNIFVATDENGKLYLNRNNVGIALNTGTVLPAGWWFTSPGSNCVGNPEDPDNGWGLPTSCGNNTYVDFCFDIRIKANPTEGNASIEIFPFADGETGCWQNAECMGGFGSNSIAISNDCGTHPDYAPLMAFYKSTNGPDWKQNTGWIDGVAGTNCDPCNGWYGIYCAQGRVEKIKLDQNEISGNLPKEIQDLTALTTLELRFNKLIGNIPKEIGNLSNLKILQLTNNSLSGTIPKEIGQCNKLFWMNVGFNVLSGNIPSEIGNIDSLQLLNLQHNKFDGSIPREFGQNNNLGFISLNHNNLIGSIPKEIGNLTKLVTLNLANNQLSDSIPSELGNLGLLTSLLLNENKFSGCVPEKLKKICGNVKQGNIGNNPSLATQSWSDFCSGVPQECNITAVENIKVENRIVLYPNPATDQIFILNRLSRSIQNIELLNNLLDQQSVIKKTDHAIVIDYLSSGVYFIKVNFDDGYEEILRFVKQ